MVKTTRELRYGLRAHGLNLADKSSLFSTSFKDSTKIRKRPAAEKVDVQTAAGGRDLGHDRGTRGAAKRETRGKRLKGAFKRMRE
eukprot:3283079-Pyramimonas_sp.AAC.2